MLQKIDFQAVETQKPCPIFANSTVLYNLNVTEPHRISQEHHSTQKVKKHKIDSGRQKQAHRPSLGGKEFEKAINKKSKQQNAKQAKSISGGSQCWLGSSYAKDACLSRNVGQGGNKIIINSNFLHQMRKRNSNSQMKHYKQPCKVDLNEDPLHLKKRKKKTTDETHSFKKQPKNAVQIIPNYTASSQINKKSSKNGLKTNKSGQAVLTKMSKTEIKSTQILQDRRCKSSLKQKKASKMLHDLKEIGKSLPLASKLNSLYSNTTSIYNSKSCIQNTQKYTYRIATQEPSDQIQEIRRYESLILTDRNISLIRSTSKKSLAKSLQVQPLKTQEIINNYIEKLKIQPCSNAQINNDKPDFNHIYSETSSNVVIREAPLDSSIIDGLASAQGGRQEGQCTKLNSILWLIQKNENKLGQGDKDKIISTIKELLQSKKIQQKERTNVQAQSKSKLRLSNSSKNDFSSQSDISVVNLQILDKALRDREEYLQKRLKREMEAVQQQCGDQQQMDRISKWINHQIRQVRQTRASLWKGLSLAKNLLSHTELNSKKKQIMKSHSESYIKSTALVKREKEVPDPPAKQRGQVLEERVEAGSDESISSIKYSPEVLQDSPQLEDLKYLSSDKYQSPQRAMREDEDNLLLSSQEKIEEEKSLERSLKRERLHCQSPSSDSNSSYDAIIIERTDTFLFSSGKKSEPSVVNISEQDKEDICQFIFLDLCLEVSEKAGAEPRIARSIAKFMRQSKERSRRNKGFKTNPTAIKEYLTHFINFLKTKPQLIQQIHDALDKPMGPTALQILKYMHTFNEDIDEQQDTYILTSNVFDMFEQNYMKTIQLERYYDDEDREAKRRNFLKNAIHIHNKAIYDAYNQTLDRDRPFGMWGKPFSWKKTAKFAHKRDTKAKNDIILKRAQQTIEYSHFMCGFILDKQDCIFKNNPQITDSYIEQVRHDRLSQLMAKQLNECEERMQFFDDEETEILVNMGQSILMKLVGEMASELMLII